MVREVGLVPMSDRYIWSLEGSVDFSVASIRKLIEDKFLPNVSSKTRWVKYVPIKVNILAWKVMMDALPVRFNLSRRDISSGESKVHIEVLLVLWGNRLSGLIG
uniref:RNA-directed DNA polymerase, eukaryota n=1 Tax=Tanacetum cinerariifolium TaxID=118510 RepID=A0A6L2NCF0_TANCI|nr:RNA-directed DNA polymerase, eukaryota [Tanacetum cinerariifolium]